MLQTAGGSEIEAGRGQRRLTGGACHHARRATIEAGDVPNIGPMRRCVLSGPKARVEDVHDVEVGDLGATWNLSRLRPRVRLNHNRSIGPLDPDSPPSRRVTARQRIGADLIDVVTTRTEALDHALSSLAGFGCPDRLAVCVVGTENLWHGRAPFRDRLPRPVVQKIATASAGGVEKPVGASDN